MVRAFCSGSVVNQMVNHLVESVQCTLSNTKMCHVLTSLHIHTEPVLVIHVVMALQALHNGGCYVFTELPCLSRCPNVRPVVPMYVPLSRCMSHCPNVCPVVQMYVLLSWCPMPRLTRPQDGNLASPLHAWSSVYWTLQRVSSLAHTSSTTACHTCCMRNCTGLTSQNVSTTNLESQCITVCSTRLRRTWSTSVHQSKTFPADVIYGQLLDITWLYHVTSSALSAIRPSRLQVRQSGTRYQTVSATRRSAATASDNLWRRICFVVTTQHTQRSRDASWHCAI